MHNIKKFFATVLILLLCFGVFSVPTLAAEISQDGLEITLTTDKNEYTQGEPIEATLTVKNTNTFALHDVSLKNIIPEGYVPADTDETTMQLKTLPAGEAVTLSVSFVSQQAEESSDIDIFSYVASLLVILSAIVMLILSIKVPFCRSILSLVMSVTTVNSGLVGTSSQGDATETDIKVIYIDTAVQVDGEQVDIKSVIEYRLSAPDSPAVHTVKFILDYEGAPQIDAQYVLHGECAVQPEGVERQGYDFAYWCIMVGDSAETVDLSKPVTEDMILYARWIKKGSDPTVNFTTFYKVSFNYPDSMTDGDILETYLPEEQLVYEGALVYSVPVPYREGYTLAAWYYDSALTKLAGAEDVIGKDTVLYPLMVEDNTPLDGMPTQNYVSDLDVTDMNHSVKVQASDVQAVKDGLVFLNITDGGTEMEFSIADNGDGTYTVRATDGLEGGKTYQLRAIDRDHLPSSPVLAGVTDDYIRFFHNGELQASDVIYYNIFTIREEINNMALADDIIFIPIGDVTGLDMETVSNLFTVTTDENGGMSMETNETEGSFRYAGNKKPEKGDLVAIYEGGSEVEEEYLTNKTVASAENTAFLEILSVDGDSYTYRAAKMFDTIFFPDLLPIPLLAETDGNPDDNTITVSDSYLDFRYLPVESDILDENTTADPGDFVAFYNGTIETATDISYGKIISVSRENGFTTITFENTTYDDIQAALDSFILCDVPVDLAESEQAKVEEQIIQQSLDSGFAEEAAAVAVREKLKMTETPVWGKLYMASPEQAETLGVDIDAGEFDAGMLQFSIDKPDVNANITTDLKRITTMNGGVGLRVTFGVYIPVSIEFVNVITNQVEESFNMDLYLTLEQEIALDVGASIDGGLDTALGFIPTDAWVRLDVYCDVGIYTGVGAVAIIDTQKNYEKQYLWEQLVKDDGSNGAFTSAESLSDQLNSMLAGGDATFFDMYKDEEGNSTLIQEYRRMLSNETDYMDILAIPLFRLKTKITPQVPIGELVFTPELVFSAKLNVIIGTSFELLNVKRYSFALYASIDDGVRAWSNPVVDKQTPYHSVNILLIGNLGLRVGIRGNFTLGLFSVKLANVGIMLEAGAYVDLYGFGYYHYDWRGATATEAERTNIQSAGAYFVDVGIYADVDLYGGVLMDTFTFTFHVFELSASLWTTGKTTYIYDVEFYQNEMSWAEKWLEQDAGWFNLAQSGRYRVKMFNIVTGDISYYTLDRSRFTIRIPEEYKSKIMLQEFYPDGKTAHLLRFTPTAEEKNLTAKVEVLLTESMKNTRAANLNSIYDLIGPATETLTLNWSRELEDVSIKYASCGPSYSYNGDRHRTTAVGGDLVPFATVTEDSEIPELPSINYLAPEVTGMIFVGWKVSCNAGAPLDGMFITDVSELAGYTMPVYDICLYPQYIPRNDTKYTVRHLLPSLTDKYEYEVFLEEVFEGTTHALVKAPDHYINNVPGISIDFEKYPITETIDFDRGTIYFFDYMIRCDGSLVIDLHYKREACPVTIHANNPDFAYYGNIPASYTTSYVFGDSVTDPGYSQVQVPGYTIAGWSTTPDGSSGITETLPDSLDFTEHEQNYGKNFYAIWQKEKVDVEVNYHLLDPHGEYGYLGTETKQVDVGTKLKYWNFEPEQISLHENAIGEKLEAELVSTNGSQPYTKDFVSVTEGTLVLDIYYTAKYSNVYIGEQQSYHIYGDTFVLPETAEKQGYLFTGWKSYYENGKMYEGGQQVTAENSHYYFIPQFVQDENTAYTVNHYKEKADGTYPEKPDDTQELYGATDSSVSPETNTYAGFDSPAEKTVEIAADGSTVVDYYYTRSVYEVIVDFRIEGETVILDGRYPSQYRYGVPFELSDWQYPLSVSREGYTFVGWYLADEELNPDHTLLEPDYYPVDNEALFSERDLVFKPMWENTPYEYKVEHYLEQLDGSFTLHQTDKPTGNLNSTVTAQPSDFNGFTYDSDNSGNIISGTVAKDGSLTLKLYYTRNSYEALWYDYDDTTLLTTTIFKYGQTITAPEAFATREGYTFGGWSIGNSTMTTKGAVYNAKDNGNWIANTYTVIFDANGGEGTMAEQPFTYDSMQELTANSYKKTGYVFSGWSLSADGTVKYTDKAQVMNLASSGKVTLYAQWEIGAPAEYKVVYYGEKLDGTGFEEIKRDSFEGITNSDVSATPINIEGFTYDVSNANNVTSGTVIGDGSLELKLYYNRNSYTLTLDFNGENLKQAYLDLEIGRTVITGFDVADKKVTVKYGQTLDEALTDITVPVMEEQWDDELGEYVMVEIDSIPFETAFPGYNFDAWEGISDTMPAEDLTLTAKWTPITITVEFYSGVSVYAPEVTGTYFEKTYSYGDTIEIPEHDFEWIDHTITGWKLGSPSAGFGQFPDIVEMPVELVYGYYSNSIHFYDGDTLGLFPYWTDNQDLLTVEFNGNGAESGEMETYYLDGESGAPLVLNKFLKEGYTFTGWNTAADGSGTYFGNGDTIDTYYAGSQSVVLYAQWKKDE